MSQQKLITQLKFTNGALLEFIVLKMVSGKTYAPGDILDQLKLIGFKTPPGSLYPLLIRLRKGGFVMTGREESFIGTGLRTYDITDKGRSRLSDLKKDWKKLDDLLHQL